MRRCLGARSGRRLADLLLGVAVIVLGTVALGLVRVLRGPAQADRLMAAQLLGTGGMAVLALIAAATDTPAVVDVALVLAILAAFVTATFATTKTSGSEADTEPPRDAGATPPR